MSTLIQRTPREIAETVSKAGQILAASEGVRRVWLFGSVARGEPLDWLSDVDLAVEGLAPETYGELLSRLEDALACSVDLVRFEEAPPALRTQIERTGRLLYEA